MAAATLLCARAGAPPPPPPTRAPRCATLEEPAQQRLAAPEPLEEALELFVGVYEPLFGVVQPATRAARHALESASIDLGLPAAELSPALLATVPSAATARDRAGQRSGRRTWRYSATRPPSGTSPRRHGGGPRALPARGVAAASDDRGPGRPPAACASRCPPPIATTGPPGRRRAEVAVAEDDDVLYARAQAHVRRALLTEGDRLVAAGVLARAGDVFWLPLDVVRRFVRGDASLTRDEASRLVTAAKEETPAANDTAPARCSQPRDDHGLGARARRRARRVHRHRPPLARRARREAPTPSRPSSSP